MDHKQISGAEFVALIIVSAILSLVLFLFNDIQELSIGGNIIKLKEAKKETEDAISQLKELRVETFRLFLEKSLDLSVGIQNMNVLMERRIAYFLKLYDKIKAANCVLALKEEILNVANTLIRDQKIYLYYYSNKLRDKLDSIGELPKPTSIYLSLESEMHNEFKNERARELSDEQIRKNLENCISAYSELYVIIQQLENIDIEDR
ncbi:hypothetical protein JZM36_15740 [Acinetobacter pittii]|uniref:hypothetical protein n=1 Tax=Acinetobacter pittii TaxID=48296 RepID=UPI00197E101D|nr:hypothetical protein [Acinetobacter pittii]MBN6518314.1 hypothetical protein [Acinetobacter pittii]